MNLSSMLSVIGAGVRTYSFAATAAASIGLALAIGGGIALAVKRHDTRIASTAVFKCEADQKLAALTAEHNALIEDQRSATHTLALRGAALETLETYAKGLEHELDDARNASPQSDAIVVPDDDPWMRCRAARAAGRRCDRPSAGALPRDPGQDAPGLYGRPALSSWPAQGGRSQKGD